MFLRLGLKEPRIYRCEPRLFFLQLLWIRKTDHRIHAPRALPPYFFWNLPLLDVFIAEVTTGKKRLGQGSGHWNVGGEVWVLRKG